MPETSTAAIMAAQDAPDREIEQRRDRSAPRLDVRPWPSTGFVDQKQILGKHGGPIPLSPATWWLGVKEGRFPQPVKIGGRTVWKVQDLNDLIERVSQAGGDGHPSRRIPAPLRRRTLQAQT
jgi:predicted DNA-binding transcriptional regulator AlpA